MEDIRSYLLRIVAAALICGLSVSIIGKEGTAASLVKFISGIFLVLTIASPLVTLSTDHWVEFWSDFSLEGKDAAQEGKDSALCAQRDIIKPKLEAYILDKAASLNMDITAELTLNTSDLPTPQSVRLTGTFSPYTKVQLSTFIEEKLGIPKEEQQWISSP